jgi:hypothetical protein
MAKDITKFANEHRWATADRRDPSAMDLDALRQAERMENTAKNVEQCLAELSAGQGQYTAEEWTEHLASLDKELDQHLDWMGARGKRPPPNGGGKGNRTDSAGEASRAASPGGAARVRNPLTAPPLPGEKDTRICRHCDKPGHVEKDCRKKKAEQLAKAGNRRQPARSLETSGNDWEESDGGDQDSMELHQPLRCLDAECSETTLELSPLTAQTFELVPSNFNELAAAEWEDATDDEGAGEEA